MPTCTVMVGLPALGKSTLIDRIMCETQEPFVYSTDNYIDQVAAARGKTYNEVFSSVIPEATHSMNASLTRAIEDWRDIIWDQTNLSVGKRRSIIDRTRRNGYRVVCVCILSPEDGHFDDLRVWKQRLESRPGKTIPKEVVSNMMKSFVVPTIDEGFDMITFYNMHGELIRTETKEN